MIAGDLLASPAQLLVRLHPNHYMRDWSYIVAEREKIFQLEKEFPHVHVVSPQCRWVGPWVITPAKIWTKNHP